MCTAVRVVILIHRCQAEMVCFYISKEPGVSTQQSDWMIN